MPQAWQRVKAKKQGKIAALVKDGTLQAKGKGKSLRVELGPFYDWLGEWARAYDIRPDDQEDVVKATSSGGSGPGRPIAGDQRCRSRTCQTWSVAVQAHKRVSPSDRLRLR